MASLVPWTLSALPTIAPLFMIAGFFALMADFLAPIFSILIKLFELVPLFFDPVGLANEIITGVTMGVSFLFEAIIGEFTPGKYIGTPSSDTAQEQLDNIKKKCYSTSFMNILFLIFCPPLAIFLNGGMGRIIEVLLCTFLTVYTYYFPGLIYAIIATTQSRNNSSCRK